MTLKTINRLNFINKEITNKKLIDVGYPVFLKNTPVRSGYARRHTLRDDDEIKAEYPYAKKLDQGYSQQSPKGMVNPTITAIRQYIKNKLG